MPASHDLPIPVPLQGGPAEVEFVSRVQDLADGLWDETQRIEAVARLNGQAPQFTSSMVATAFVRVTDPFSTRSRRDWKDLALYLGGAGFGGVAGVSGNYLDDRWALVTFPLALSLAVIFGAAAYLRGGD